MNTNTQKAKIRKQARAKGVISTIVVAIVALIAILLLTMRLFGFSFYTVMSGSMEPNYHVGSLVFVKNTKVDSLQKGDVIAFMLDEKTIVTHRIIDIKNSGNSLKFQTKGDANDAADANLVHNKNVLGKASFSIPLLGYVAWYIQRPPGVYIAAVAVIAILAAVFLPSFLKRKEKTASK